MTTRDEILQGVRSWFKTAIGAALTDAKIIPANAKGPRPSLPYLTVLVATADAPDGVDESGHFDDGLGGCEWRARGERAATVDVQGHDRTGETTTAGWLEDAAIRLQRPDVQAVLDAAGLSIVNRGTVLDVSALLDTEIERRHLRSFEVRYTLRDTGPGLPEAVIVEIDPIVLERYDNHPDPLIVQVTVDPF